MYCNPDELNKHILLAQQTGTLSDELVRLLTLMAGGVWAKLKRNRKRWYSKRASWEDARQQCLLRTLQILDRLETGDNCFSYLASVYLNEIRMMARGALAYRRAIEALAARSPAE